MNRREWEKQFRKRLSSLPKNERTKALEYYGEMYPARRDVGMTEEEILREFGDPADAAEKLDRLGVRETTQGRCEEFGRTADLFQKLSLGAHVGQVAATLAGDAHLTCGLLHLLGHEYPVSGPGGHSGGHEARSPRSGYDYVILLHALFSQR